MFVSIDRSNNVEMSPRLKNYVIHYNADENVGSALYNLALWRTPTVYI